MKVLVCGGRNFGVIPFNATQAQLLKALEQMRFLEKTLNELHKKQAITEIIEGDARGADKLAGKWAVANHIALHTFPADWQTHGKRAGFIRNETMLKIGKPAVVIAFPGGNGTKHMVKLAKDAGVPVIEVEYDAT